MTPLPPTASAAQSNRQIQEWLEELALPVTGPHRRQDLCQAIEAMYLRSLNQVRATQHRPALTHGPSYFAQPKVVIKAAPVRLNLASKVEAPVHLNLAAKIDPAVEKSLPLHIDTGMIQDLERLTTHLSSLEDRSSPEARKTRKQIRHLKDLLGIPR